MLSRPLSTALAALLRAHPDRATEVGERLFPPREASLIAELVRRDAPTHGSTPRQPRH